MDPKDIKKWSLVNLSMEMGFIIALPLVAFAFAGRWLDHKVGNETQWFTLLGIVFAVVSTTIWLGRRINSLMKK